MLDNRRSAIGQPAQRRKSGGLGEVVRTVVFALLIAVGIRTIAFEPFNIPSGSMIPTLLIGDYLFVEKYAYGYSRYSFPFGPNIFSGRVFGSDPARGDVVVFKLPSDTSTDYIKRIIGLPGDVIEVNEDQVTINGVKLAYTQAGVFEGKNGASLDDTGTNMLREELPGRPHTVMDTPGSPFAPGTWVVPPGQYFAMGDNRDHSADSRDWGFVPEANLVGRAMVIWLNCEGWACSDGFDYSRIGDTIR